MEKTKPLFNKRALVKIHKANNYLRFKKREEALKRMRESIEKMESKIGFINTLIK
jgi:hypothetical protein